MIQKIPEAYKGKLLKNGGHTITSPRKWTKEEIDWCLQHSKQGCSAKEIAESMGRSLTSVELKLKRLCKKDRTYNKDHLEEKYSANVEFAKLVSPESVLDVFSGMRSWWATNLPEKNVVTNDIDISADTHFHLNALNLVCQEYLKQHEYDIVDLDPFGSAFDCFDLAVKMSKKGLIVTFGELGHKRWKRLDFVKPRYGIQTMEQFTTEALVKYVQRIGEANHKKLVVSAMYKWRLISRVYFTVETSVFYQRASTKSIWEGYSKV